MSEERKTQCLTVKGTKFMALYDWINGTMTASSDPRVSAINTNGNVSEQRLYISLVMPQLPPNALVKKVMLALTAKEFSKTSSLVHNIGVYEVKSNITTGETTPECNTVLEDYEAVTFSNKVKDEFELDITALADRCINDGKDSINLMMKIVDSVPRLNVGFYGVDTAYLPRVKIEYETDFSMSTIHRTNTHSIGRFGQGIVDVVDGRLLFSCEDFSWGGNLMAVHLSHQYSSALSDYQYSRNSDLGLKVANFSSMKLGLGWKLNLMQSMVEDVDENGAQIYVYTDSSGNQTYFKVSSKTTYCESSGCSYNLFEDVDGNEIYYDNLKRILTIGETAYTFDVNGRLVSVSNGKSTMSVAYASNKITSVTDGVGRMFTLDYTTDNYLLSVTAPDKTKVIYSYTNDLLTSITYPDGTVANIEYSKNKPMFVNITAAGKTLYKVGYTFNGDKLATVTEYGLENEQLTVGTTTQYAHYASSNKTHIVTTVPADADENEDTVINTVYTFDDDGNAIGEYVYTDEGEKAEGCVGSGINPLGSALGVESNVDNLLLNHAFNGLTHWAQGPANCDECSVKVFENEAFAKYGRKILGMASCNDAENVVYQDTVMLPAGEYTLSAYVKIAQDFDTATNGAYVRAETTEGTVICESERIYKCGTEYTRVIAPFKLTEAQSIRVCLCTNGNGTVYFNGVQLEKNTYANRYNLLQNSNFEHELMGWDVSDNTALSETECFNMSHSLCITSDLDTQNSASQQVAVKSALGTRETFTLSGWAKGCGLPNRERTDRKAPQFSLNAIIKYTDGTTETHTKEFLPCTDEWQPAELTFAKEKYLGVESITVNCNYSYNTGTAHFDDIRLFRTNIETDLAESDFVSNESESYTASEEIEVFEEATDEYGNVITSTTYSDGEFGTIYSSYDYSGENVGNDLVGKSDSRGNVTQYDVDAATSRNTVVTDRCGNKTKYGYDALGRTNKIIRMTSDEITLSQVEYAHDNFNNITEITRGDGMVYSLVYNGYHQLESIGVKDAVPLVTYGYKNGNGRMKTVSYANGYMMKTVYNSYGQLMAEKWYVDSEATEPCFEYRYTYDSAGNLVRSIDTNEKVEYNYTYENGRIVRSTQVDISVTPKALLSSVEYSYNSDGYLVKKTVTVGSDVTVYKTEYPENASPVTKVTLNGKSVGISHSKTDSFGRKVFDEIQTGSGFISRQFSYHAGQVTEEHKTNGKLKSSPTTNLVSQIVLSDGRTISYEYDAEERITRVTDSIEGIAEYEYDSLGQLTKETVIDATGDTVINSMTYDNYGNILTKNGVQYQYDNGWKDKLIAVGDKTITYDAQGNPTNYLGNVLTWEKGRQLKSFGSTTYTYNASGVRTSKTVSGIKHDYVLDGTKILQEKWEGNTLTPIYDNAGAICGINHNGTAYYFLKNLQGDIIAITNTEGEMVARYTYDAWGKCTIAQDTTVIGIATINPFRYRGYYYDTETKLYYLNSRYYDPGTARFLNSDSPDYVVIAGGNLYAYCNNSPTGSADYYGFCATVVVPGESGKGNSETTWLDDLMKPFIPNFYYSFGVNTSTIIDVLLIRISAVYGMSFQSNPDALWGILLASDEKEIFISIPLVLGSSLGVSFSYKNFEVSVTIGLYYSLNMVYYVAGLKFTFSPLNFACVLLWLNAKRQNALADVLDYAFNNKVSNTSTTATFTTVILLILSIIFGVPLVA